METTTSDAFGRRVGQTTNFLGSLRRYFAANFLQLTQFPAPGTGLTQERGFGMKAPFWQGPREQSSFTDRSLRQAKPVNRCLWNAKKLYNTMDLDYRPGRDDGIVHPGNGILLVRLACRSQATQDDRPPTGTQAQARRRWKPSTCHPTTRRPAARSTTLATSTDQSSGRTTNQQYPGTGNCARSTPRSGQRPRRTQVTKAECGKRVKREEISKQ
jgi:hypothetical protein